MIKYADCRKMIKRLEKAREIIINIDTESMFTTFTDELPKEHSKTIYLIDQVLNELRELKNVY